ncbi:AMP-binding protein [Roseiarcus sp.]|jgi:acyl-CoA synthetase|uniref:AMP-binding protein n=1 Tax=Roseiarcus sp. TaxID=1969460 RepID=UPI003D11CD1C
MLFPTIDPARAASYHASGAWGGDAIPGLIAKAGEALPDKVAVRDSRNTVLTYRELGRRSDRLAAFLAARDVRQGDIVTVCMPNWSETVVVFLAVMKLGAVINPVPVTYGRADLAYALTKCDSRALFVPRRFRNADFTRVVSELGAELIAWRTVVFEGEGDLAIGTSFADALAADGSAPKPTIRADDPVAVLFTSGTESRAKGAVHTHNTILFGERALATMLGLSAEDMAFMASPISHTTGFMHGVIMTLTLGGSLSLLDIFEGKAAARQIADHHCSWTMGATPFLSDIASALEATGERLPSLRYFLCGGAPIPEALVRRAESVGLRVLAIYGSTESPPHTVVFPSDPRENSWTTDGRPLPGIEAKIVSGGASVPDGEVGEEWSRGPNTFLGYLGDPELTLKDFQPDGWYHSGDLARRLPDGSIRIVGRLKDIIVRGGQNISAREVEDYLAAHPAIHSAALVGVPHPRLGETGCAVVVVRAGKTVTLPEITDFLLAKGVARFKLPERLEVWPQLPLNPSGKVQKFLIRKALGESADKESA